MARLQSVITRSRILIILCLIGIGLINAAEGREAAKTLNGRAFITIPAGQTSGQAEIDYSMFPGRPLAFATTESEGQPIIITVSTQTQNKLIIYAELLTAEAQPSYIEVNWRLETYQ